MASNVDGKDNLVQSGFFVRGMAIVAIEQGGDPGVWLDRLKRGYTNHCIVRQGTDESISAFASRVRAQVHDLEERGLTPFKAVLAPGLATDEEASQKRLLMLRVLSSAMARAGRGDVVVVPPEAVRTDMQALVEAVRDQLGGTDVDISMGVGEGAVRSPGLRWPRSVVSIRPKSRRVG